MSQTSGATRRLWDTKAPPTSALRDYGLASQARDTDGDGAPIFTPEFPKADPYLFGKGHGRLGRVETVLLTRAIPIGTKGADRSTQARRAVPLY